MENRKRVLPQWLSRLEEKSPTKKCRSTNVKRETTGKGTKGSINISETIDISGLNVDSSNCNKTSDSLLDSKKKSSRAQVGRFELSSSDDDNGESCDEKGTEEGIENGNIINVQLSNEIVSDDSNPLSPSIVHSNPTPSSPDNRDDTDCELKKSQPPSPEAIQSELSPKSSDTSNNETPSGSNNDYSASTKLVRPICKYGNECYRKNPQHKVDFSHPGDDDFTSIDNRPECEYGLSCYRKNPLHRQHYKHTKKVLKRRKAKQPGNTAVNKNSSDEDEYDLEDPFINDDSSDDYEPEGSDDDTDLSDACTFDESEER